MAPTPNHRHPVTLVAAAALLGGCASPPPAPAPVAMTAAAPVAPPPPATGLHAAVAWVPRHLAATPAVAEAVVRITLARAREATRQVLCHGGWMPSGAVQQVVGPLPAPSARPAWYYRISWRPDELDCAGVTAPQFYRALAAHLPAWMHLETTARSQGRLTWVAVPPAAGPTPDPTAGLQARLTPAP